MPINSELDTLLTSLAITSSPDHFYTVAASTSEAKKKKEVKAVNTDPWIRLSKEKKIGFKLATFLGKKKVEGDIGIEIEVEGNKFPKDSSGPKGTYGVWKSELIPVAYWKYVHDGSLRGDDNAEYVLRKPLRFEEVPEAITALWKMFEEAKCKLDESNRTSVHVHLNAQEWHLNRLCSFAALYFCFEELLTEWCGDHRVGNMFCLRAKDAPAIVTKLKRFLSEEDKHTLSEGLHYSGLNVYSLCKYGSVEIRSLRGCTDPNTILQWVSILERLYKVSAEFPDPRTICDGFSGEGPMAYLHRVLGDSARVIIEGINWDNQRIIQSLYEGIRLAQDICYCRDWSLYEPVDLDPDPFGRSTSGLVKSMYNLQSDYTILPVPEVPVDPYVPEPDSEEDYDWMSDSYFDEEGL